MLTYSRDTMAWPIRLMEEMIQQINLGSFVPDASRNGYFPTGAPADYEGKDSDSTSSSGDSKDEEDFEHSADEQTLSRRTGGRSCGRHMGLQRRDRGGFVFQAQDLTLLACNG